jgi:hypothetical protein
MRRLIHEGVAEPEARRMATEEFALAVLATHPAPPTDFTSTKAILLALAALLGVAGAAYAPVALLASTLLESAAIPFDYGFGVGTIRRLAPSYRVCVGASGTIFLLVFAMTTAAIGGLALPAMGPLAQSALVGAGSGALVYSMLVFSSLIGLYYFHEDQRFGWSRDHLKSRD